MKSTLQFVTYCRTCSRKYPVPSTGICGVCSAEEKRQQELAEKYRRMREDHDRDPQAHKVEHSVSIDGA